MSPDALVSPDSLVSPDAVIGAIMAGGMNTRYGALKALEKVGGRRIIDRALHALQEVTPAVIMIANDPAAYVGVNLRTRPDLVPALGALGGIQSALAWARQLGAQGILAVACDLPFLNSDLLRAILAAAQSTGADVVAPESGGRRGIEPLCAYYGISCLPAIERSIERNDLRMIGFHDEVTLVALPLAQVEALGDPAVLFMNVNTREELARAEQIEMRDARCGIRDTDGK